MRLDSRSVTLGAFPIHQRAHCQAYCWGCLSRSSYLPDLWLVKWMTPAWFPMSDDMSGLTRGFQTDPLSGSPHLETNLFVCVCVSMCNFTCIYRVYMRQCLFCKANVFVVISKFLICVIIIGPYFSACFSVNVYIFWDLWHECADIPLYTQKLDKWNWKLHWKSQTDSVNTSFDGWPPAFWSHRKHFFLHRQVVHPCLLLGILYSLLSHSSVFCSSFPFPFSPFLHAEVH